MLAGASPPGLYRPPGDQRASVTDASSRQRLVWRSIARRPPTTSNRLRHEAKLLASVGPCRRRRLGRMGSCPCFSSWEKPLPGTGPPARGLGPPPRGDLAAGAGVGPVHPGRGRHLPARRCSQPPRPAALQDRLPRRIRRQQYRPGRHPRRRRDRTPRAGQGVYRAGPHTGPEATGGGGKPGGAGCGFRGRRRRGAESSRQRACTDRTSRSTISRAMTTSCRVSNVLRTRVWTCVWGTGQGTSGPRPGPGLAAPAAGGCPSWRADLLPPAGDGHGSKAAREATPRKGCRWHGGRSAAAGPPARTRGSCAGACGC